MVLHNVEELNDQYLGENVCGTKGNAVLILQQKATRENADIITTFHFKSILGRAPVLRKHPNQLHHPGIYN